MNKYSLSISYENNHVDIPYYVFEGKSDGPTFFLSGGMHGDEINGIAIVSRFLERFISSAIEERMFGKLYVIPVLNVSGFRHRQRTVFEDGKDPNRSYGYKEVTTFSEAIAKHLSDEIFQYCDYGIDVHDAGDRNILLPHPRFHSCNHESCDLHTRRMGQLFGTMILIERSGKDGMLAVEMNRKFDMPVLTLEIGGNQVLYDEYYAQSLQGLRNIFIDYGLFEGDIIIDVEEQVILHNRYFIKSQYAGIVSLDVKLFDRVHAGDLLGTIFYPLMQESSDIVSPLCGVVFSLGVPAQLKKNKTILSIVGDKSCHIKKSMNHAFEEDGPLFFSEISM